MANAWILWSKAPSASASQCLTSSQREEIKTTTTATSEDGQGPESQGQVQQHLQQPFWLDTWEFWKCHVTSWTKSWTCMPLFFWIPKFEAPSGDKYVFLVATSNPCLIHQCCSRRFNKKNMSMWTSPCFFEADFCVGRCCFDAVGILVWFFDHGRLDAFWGKLWGDVVFFFCGLPWGLWEELEWVEVDSINKQDNQPENRNQKEWSQRNLYVTSVLLIC